MTANTYARAATVRTVDRSSRYQSDGSEFAQDGRLLGAKFKATFGADENLRYGAIRFPAVSCRCRYRRRRRRFHPAVTPWQRRSSVGLSGGPRAAIRAFLSRERQFSLDGAEIAVSAVQKSPSGVHLLYPPTRYRNVKGKRKNGWERKKCRAGRAYIYSIKEHASERPSEKERDEGKGRPVKRGNGTVCLATVLHIPGDRSAKSAGRSIFSLANPFFLSFAVYSGSFLLAPRGKSRRIDDPDARYRPHVSVQSGLCLFLGSVGFAARVNPLRRVVSISENAL